MELYPQARAYRPGIEYLPHPSFPTDLLPALKGEGSRGLGGYSPLAGATPL
ncbi:MAG: hypothetical protein ACP5GH_03165 [Nitrososphaeria archaeon]